MRSGLQGLKVIEPNNLLVSFIINFTLFNLLVQIILVWNQFHSSLYFNLKVMQLVLS